MIAVGSSPIRLPGWTDDHRIWDSTAALELRSIPKRLAIVGGGIIGLEMATLYSALGSKVTVIEFTDQIVPGAENDAVGILHNALEAQGYSFGKFWVGHGSMAADGTSKIDEALLRNRRAVQMSFPER